MTRRRSISNGNLLQLHPSASAATRGGGGGGSGGGGSSVEDDGEGQRVGSVGSVGDADPLTAQQLQCHTVSDGCPLSGVDVWHSTAGTRVYL